MQEEVFEPGRFKKIYLFHFPRFKWLPEVSAIFWRPQKSKPPEKMWEPAASWPHDHDQPEWSWVLWGELTEYRYDPAEQEIHEMHWPEGSLFFVPIWTIHQIICHKFSISINFVRRHLTMRRNKRLKDFAEITASTSAQ